MAIPNSTVPSEFGAVGLPSSGPPIPFGLPVPSAPPAPDPTKDGPFPYPNNSRITQYKAVECCICGQRVEFSIMRLFWDDEVKRYTCGR